MVDPFRYTIFVITNFMNCIVSKMSAIHHKFIINSHKIIDPDKLTIVS